MAHLLQNFAKDTSGATALEYGIMAGLISAVIITAVTNIGITIRDTFTNINGALGGVAA